jgi:hypothetical protein
VLPAFLLCSALLIMKMYVVAVITGQVRLRKKVCGAPGNSKGAAFWLLLSLPCEKVQEQGDLAKVCWPA